MRHPLDAYLDSSYSKYLNREGLYTASETVERKAGAAAAGKRRGRGAAWSWCCVGSQGTLLLLPSELLLGLPQPSSIKDKYCGNSAIYETCV